LESKLLSKEAVHGKEYPVLTLNKREKSSFSRAISSIKSSAPLLRGKIKTHMQEQLSQTGAGSA